MIGRISQIIFFAILWMSGNAVFSQAIKVNEGVFEDQFGRTRHFRGISVASSNKVPLGANCISTPEPCEEVSFVGRPFPLNEADEHLIRLKTWGFNLIRLVVTWEALEHRGPGQYDMIYIAYIRRVVEKAREHGFYVVIDPHQNAWSRWTGGAGAPRWTLEKVGFDPELLIATGAAITFPDPTKAEHLTWGTNYTKLGASTMFTLFYGGKQFAPRTMIDSLNVQDYLQQHYLASMAQLARALIGYDNVIGFAVMNEPYSGWIGHEDLNEYTSFPLKIGPIPTPVEAIALGAGYSREVTNWVVGLTGMIEDGAATVNPYKLRVWKEGYRGVWRENNLWRIREGVFNLTRRDYFSQVKGQPVDFAQDFYAPFVRQFAQAIRAHLPRALILVEKPIDGPMPEIPDLDGLVNGSHWYDPVTMGKKKFYDWASLDVETQEPIIGKEKVDQYFLDQLALTGAYAKKLNPDAATLIGEIGIPFDLSDGISYREGPPWDFSEQEQALDRSLRSVEHSNLSYALWNYSPDNTNLAGDHWNGEDFSIYSSNQALEDSTHVNSGGRALRAVIRPFAPAVSGSVKSADFDMNTGRYQLIYTSDENSSVSGLPPTEIVLPRYYYEAGIEHQLSDGRLVQSENPDVWNYFPINPAIDHSIVITPAREMHPIENSNWWGIVIGLVFVVMFWVTWRRMDHQYKTLP